MLVLNLSMYGPFFCWICWGLRIYLQWSEVAFLFDLMHLEFKHKSRIRALRVHWPAVPGHVHHACQSLTLQVGTVSDFAILEGLLREFLDES